jgi:hypothetical protein
MRCAECGDKITRKPIRRGKLAYCSRECAEAAAEYDDDRDYDDQAFEDEDFSDFQEEEDEESGDMAYDAEEDDR